MDDQNLRAVEPSDLVRRRGFCEIAKRVEIVNDEDHAIALEKLIQRLTHEFVAVDRELREHDPINHASEPDHFFPRRRAQDVADLLERRVEASLDDVLEQSIAAPREDRIDIPTRFVSGVIAFRRRLADVLQLHCLTPRKIARAFQSRAEYRNRLRQSQSSCLDAERSAHFRSPQPMRQSHRAAGISAARA